ncbi:hypothetical protein PGH12_01785 [Chryseobacterium wangxinyae]|uniref:hypothetical protein n=1 Tax=Chryseobacterium sp. CY350 TaxID=2997336 RepID=UPI00226DFEE3|nr:hypothetical protein [Chryseobacterium sp. CY350]MCY0979259.1 hypothetical protein [Chryseobacterium sp. CY350]WBZ95892.1 hypothetical protein PGH12_01785 [Chryseobacterium sp. CY350]
MNKTTKLENTVVIPKEIERQRALKILEKAKLLNRKVVLLANEASGHINPNILF